MVENVCNNIQQEELLAVHGKELSVPVNVLRKGKYILHNHDTKDWPWEGYNIEGVGGVGGEIVGEREW